MFQNEQRTTIQRTQPAPAHLLALRRPGLAPLPDRLLRRHRRDVVQPFIIMTDYAEVNTAVESMKLGYKVDRITVIKPDDSSKLRIT